MRGVELPFGDEPASWWIDGSGAVHDRPVTGADLLPGGYFLPGLVDAHAHPAVGSGPAGLVPLDAEAAPANLTAWARAGIRLVRDTGSAGGLTLGLGSGPGLPAVQAAGRFLAPVLAGTDVTGWIPREVALLARMGLQPHDALAAASTWRGGSSVPRPPPTSSPTTTTPARTRTSSSARPLAESGCDKPR